MASTDSRPLPLKNTAFRLYFTAYDSSGVPVTAFTRIGQSNGSYLAGSLGQIVLESVLESDANITLLNTYFDSEMPT